MCLRLLEKFLETFEVEGFFKNEAKCSVENGNFYVCLPKNLVFVSFPTMESVLIVV